MDTLIFYKMFSIELLPTTQGSGITRWMLDQKVDKVRYDRLIVIKFLSRCIIVFTVLVTMHIQYVKFVEPLCVASQGHLLSS